ncbi:MAG: agmatine deiminase family protein [Saprospiraceae bacterium]|jgi:agmatine deiminase|nr:agmatine deiminase family protein [Candidatus Brachybacter algidus]MBP7304708.1 agmatine deiminase family protein [Saprospiraceae bacterium]MBK8843093.1 agmatine deiminase family protein [Candidatus Brachybacter algidus]MBK9024336.1 agmatine deiminase family protein [Candidatus Brachybacter algidus]MBP7539829.1 agmatine deiminase family protein [Saprospiraceae bacterium]
MNRVFPAEWAPQSAISFTFPHKDSDWADDLDKVIPTFVEIISIVTIYEKALVVCQNVEEVGALLKNANQKNLILIELPSNDTWARDHSAITVLDDGQPLLLDFMFNGWGLKFPADKDNLITKRLKEQGIFGSIPVQSLGLNLEGGALESDGAGTLLTTTECLLSPNRNPQFTKNVLETYLKLILGIDRILWLDYGYLEGDDTDSHIDTLARFCSPDTIAYVQCDDVEDVHYDSLKRMEDQLLSFTQEDGSPYNLVPLPMAPARYHHEDGHRLPATYANFLIINDAVLLPIYGDEEKDKKAIAAMKVCFPDREIHAIDCNSIILQHGSLHCITMQFPEGIIE